MKLSPVPLVACLAAAALSVSSYAAAEQVEVPPIVVAGLQEFQQHGSLAAVNTWRAGSARETDDEALDQASGRMSRIREVNGRMLGWEFVRAVSLSPSTRRVYAVVKFEKGVAWMSFDCYRPQQEWIIPSFDFQIRANLILPPAILGGQ